MNKMNPNLEIIHQRIKAGKYLIRSHAVKYALKEGFNRQHIIEAVLKGKIIEEYPDQERVLFCGKTALTENIRIYLHVVCEYADRIYVEIITAYIPDELLWEKPTFRRRKRKRK